MLRVAGGQELGVSCQRALGDAMAGMVRRDSLQAGDALSFLEQAIERRHGDGSCRAHGDSLPDLTEQYSSRWR